MPGYHAERKVAISQSSDCTAELKIWMDDEGKPSYSCRCVCDDNIHGAEHGGAVRPVINKFLASCGAKTPGAGGRRWHGPECFGFNRPDQM